MSCARSALAGADRREQVAVLVDAVEEVRQAVEHQVPDAQRQVQVALERLLQVRVAGAAVDEAVDLGVERHQLVGAAAVARVDLGDERVELARAAPASGARRRGSAAWPSSWTAHVGDVREVGDVDLRREVPRRGKTVTRFSSARRLIASRTGVRPISSSRPSASSLIGAPGGMRQRDDAVAQRGVGAIGEQLAGGPRSTVQPPVDDFHRRLTYEVRPYRR